MSAPKPTIDTKKITNDPKKELKIDFQIKTNAYTIEKLINATKPDEIIKVIKDDNFKLYAINGREYNYKKFLDEPQTFISEYPFSKISRVAKATAATVVRGLKQTFTRKGGNRKTHNKKKSLNKSRKNMKLPM